MGSPNDLTRRVVADFCARFARHGRVLWVSEPDTEPIEDSKTWRRELCLSTAAVRELPNVVVRDSPPLRLWLIDVATLGRHMSVQRRRRLSHILRRSHAELLFLTAFENRPQMTEFIVEPPWGTIAWFADEPDHLVHFDDHPDPGRLTPQDNMPSDSLVRRPPAR